MVLCYGIKDDTAKPKVFKDGLMAAKIFFYGKAILEAKN